MLNDRDHVRLAVPRPDHGHHALSPRHVPRIQWIQGSGEARHRCQQRGDVPALSHLARPAVPRGPARVGVAVRPNRMNPRPAELAAGPALAVVAPLDVVRILGPTRGFVWGIWRRACEGLFTTEYKPSRAVIYPHCDISAWPAEARGASGSGSSASGRRHRAPGVLRRRLGAPTNPAV